MADAALDHVVLDQHQPELGVRFGLGEVRIQQTLPRLDRLLSVTVLVVILTEAREVSLVARLGAHELLVDVERLVAHPEPHVGVRELDEDIGIAPKARADLLQELRGFVPVSISEVELCQVELEPRLGRRDADQGQVRLDHAVVITATLHDLDDLDARVDRPARFGGSRLVVLVRLLFIAELIEQRRQDHRLIVVWPAPLLGLVLGVLGEAVGAAVDTDDALLELAVEPVR